MHLATCFCESKCVWQRVLVFYCLVDHILTPRRNYWRNCWILKKLRWTFGYSCRYAVAGSMGLMLLKLEQNQRLKVFQTSQTQLRLVLRCHLLHQWNFRIFASLTSPGETHGSFKTSGLHVNIRGRQELALQTFFPILPKFL